MSYYNRSITVSSFALKSPSLVVSDHDSRPFCFPVPIRRCYHMTHVLLLPFSITVWTLLVLAIIHII